MCCDGAKTKRRAGLLCGSMSLPSILEAGMECLQRVCVCVCVCVLVNVRDVHLGRALPVGGEREGMEAGELEEEVR